MDLRELRSRIDSLKGSNISEQRKTVNAGDALVEKGWNRLSEMVYEKVSVKKIILPEAVPDVLLDKNTCKGDSIPSSRLIFYDTETTGLSAGAGNIVFLAGFGEQLPDKDYFSITQLFLSDFPGEPLFLETLKRFLKPDRIYVSYNGKSFDSNVLKTRFAINRIIADLGFQLDLLYPSRRIWKNIIGSCSLGDIERKVLDKHRELDVPGYMVPDLYFDFIRTGRWETIEPVFAHHLEDIASLAELLTVHEQLIEEAGTESSTGYFDPLGLAALLADSSPDSAIRILSSAFSGGNSRAGIELSMMLKRTGMRSEAVQIWNSLWDEGRSIFAGIELAKHYEHYARDTSAALKITKEMLSLERFRIQAYSDDLAKRLKRLETKIKQKRCIND